MAGTTDTWDQIQDVIILGSGAAGLTAAIAARAQGLQPLLIEKSSSWGGTTAISGGALWVPCNRLMRRDGDQDSLEAARTYMHSLAGADNPAASAARQEAFLQAAPELVEFLAARGFEWIRNRSYPDYQSDVAGASWGRSLESAIYDGRKLGPWLRSMRRGPANVPAMTTSDIPAVTHALHNPAFMLTLVGLVLKTALARLAGKAPLGMGQALVGRLMERVLGEDIPVYLATATTSLLTENGRVIGIVAEREGRPLRIGARRGVMLCCGGFARNAALRLRYQPVDGSWSNAAPDDQGDAITLTAPLDAATAQMDSAWWIPTLVGTLAPTAITLPERTVPGSVIVDQRGSRYLNEAQGYMTAGQAMLKHNRDGAAIPSWLILDDRCYRRHLFGALPPNRTLKQRMLDAGTLIRADTMDELARQCGIEATTLAATLARFNGFARNGVDADFGRGQALHDRHWADAAHRPNPSLGPIDKPPFWACRLYPGDLGTNGGLLTDEHARVLDTHGKVIEGLYAAGNASASVTGRSYPGAGATIAAAMTFAYLGARHAARMASSLPD